MDFLSLAKKRYACRSYQQRKVEPEKIAAILEAGRVAPTGANRQPQRLVVVESAEGMERLARCTRDFGAPLAIIVCADTNEVWTRKYDGKKIGEHNGAHYYTIGQRKGLGIGGRRESLFILATDTVQNVIWVGEGDAHPGLWRPALHIAPGEIHWVNPARELTAGQSARFSVRIRYRQPLQGARLFVRDEGAYLVFDRPQRGITPGQFAAWYDGDQLVGSGVIEG